MIKRIPLSKDPPGKCSRWRVIVYNKETKKYDWHTVRGTRDDAKALERKFEDAKSKGEYSGPIERKTFDEVANLFLDDRRANNRRVSTLEEYQTELRIRLLAPPNGTVPALGPRDIRNIKRADMKVHFNTLRNSGCTISQVNKAIKAAKAIFTYAFDLEYVTSNVMHRYPKLLRVDGERVATRGVFTEAELRSSRTRRPLNWPCSGHCPSPVLGLAKSMHSTGRRSIWTPRNPIFRVERAWCSKGLRFYAPKTQAGRRTVPISAWLASILRKHRAGSGGVGLVFPSSAGTPLNKANVRKRMWIPLLARAEIPYRDMYSLRWTFVSLARASGQAAFNVSRVIGHARSTIVDTIYAHTVDSALAGVSQSVEDLVGLKLHEQPTPPVSPAPPRQPPKLRVIEGGRDLDVSDQRDIRRTIDDAGSAGSRDGSRVEKWRGNNRR